MPPSGWRAAWRTLLAVGGWLLAIGCGVESTVSRSTCDPCYLFLYLFIYLFIHLVQHLFIHLFIYLFIYLFMYT